MNLSMRILQLRGKTMDFIQRFPVTAFWQMVGFFVGAGIILLRPEEVFSSIAQHNTVYDHLTRLPPAIYGAWMMAAVCRLFADAFPMKKSVLLSAACSSLLGVILAYCWYDADSPGSHLIIGTGGVYLALGFLALFLMERQGASRALPALLFSTGFSLGTALLLFLGLSVSIAAFWALIMPDENAWLMQTSYLFVGLIAYGVWGLGAFLGTLPKAEDSYELSAIAQKVLLYLLFPIYGLLLLILYLYIVKIIYAGAMPVGTMNWYASFALLGFVFFFGALSAQNRMPLFTRFLRWGLLLFLPILIVQLYGVYLRYAAYGLTTPRYTSIICTFCGIYALTAAFLKRKPQQVYLCAASLALIFTLTPLNVIDVPLHSQEERLSKILKEHNLLHDGQIIKSEDTPPAVIEEIADIAVYIGRDASPLAAAVLDAHLSSASLPQNHSFYFYDYEPKEFSLSGAHTLIFFHENHITPEGFLILPRADGHISQIDLRPYMSMLVSYGEQHPDHILYKDLQDYETGVYDVHFSSIDITKTPDENIRLESANGFVLIH